MKKIHPCALSNQQADGNPQSGFTLPEMAIVLVIIGLLTGGILQGRSIYHNVQIKSVYSEVQAIQVAYTAFKKKYNALPGDMRNAQLKLAGCSGNCTNGVTNDSFIGQPNQQINAPISSSGQSAENILFFYHLKQAGLIQDVDAQSPTSTGEWGKVAPKAGSAPGGLIVKSINQDLCNPTGEIADMAGTWLVWQESPFAAADQSTIVNSRDAAMLDAKYDDGLPGYGDIRAGGANPNPVAVNDGCRDSLKSYSNNGSCYMYFRISRDIN